MLYLLRQSLQFPIQVKVLSIQETKEYHLRKLYELSKKSIGKIPQYEEPTYEQKIWVLSKLSHSDLWPNVDENKIGYLKTGDEKE